MINKIYLNNKTLDQIKEEFNKIIPNRIVLQEFVDPNTYKLLEELIKKSDKRKEKIADRYSYSILKNQEIINIFDSDEFTSFLGIISNRKINKIGLNIKQFFHKDYTLIHDSLIEKPSCRFFFFIPTNGFDENSGGSSIFRIDKGKKEDLVFKPTKNTFCLINSKTIDPNFIKYLNNKSKNESLTIIEGLIS